MAVQTRWRECPRPIGPGCAFAGALRLARWLEIVLNFPRAAHWCGTACKMRALTLECWLNGIRKKMAYACFALENGDLREARAQLQVTSYKPLLFAGGPRRHMAAFLKAGRRGSWLRFLMLVFLNARD